MKLDYYSLDVPPKGSAIDNLDNLDYILIQQQCICCIKPDDIGSSGPDLEET
jgi:hypothetical protein